MGICCSSDDSVSQPVQRGKGKGKGQQWGGGKALGGGGSMTNDELRLAATNAAEAGRVENEKLGDPNKFKREQLVGKIQSYYASAGVDPPIGLSASQDIGALKKHLEHAKKLGKTNY